MVPWSAASNLPILSLTAPVKAPFMWPNSSLSRRLSGMAPQWTAMKGLSLRCPLKWIALATISLPVPDSPMTSTVESVLMIRFIRLKTFCMAGELPMMLANSNLSRSCFFR